MKTRSQGNMADDNEGSVASSIHVNTRHKYNNKENYVTRDKMKTLMDSMNTLR